MLLGLLQGTEAASHGGADHTTQALLPTMQEGSGSLLLLRLCSEPNSPPSALSSAQKRRPAG